MADLDEFAMALESTTKQETPDGRPSYRVAGKLFCCHRTRRRDAIDRDTGELLDDVLMFCVADLGAKEALVADRSGRFFTTPHFNGFAAVLLRIADLAEIDRSELAELVADAWLAKAPKRLAAGWLADRGLSS